MMLKDKRNLFDKLNTLLFGRDLRITKGDVFSQIRPFDYSSYYPENAYIMQQKAPDNNVYDIRLYGADVSLEDNAPFINKAIEHAHQTGGTVLVCGGEYTASTVYLKSDVTLFIERDSSIAANKKGVGYNHKGILHAENVDNITLTGGGKVKGYGEFFGRKPLADENMTAHPEIIDVIQMRRDYRAQLRFAHESKYGGAIYFKDCTNVRAENFIIESSAHWSFRIENCNYVRIKNFVINNNRHVANADGFDIAGTSNIDIRHCFVSTADDGICIKNAVWLGNKGKMENISISDCEVVSCCNSIKIGTETTYDIENVNISECRLFMTDLYPGSVSGIAIESADGSAVTNVTVKNIYMNRVTCPVFVRLCNRNRAAEVTAQSANAVEFSQKKVKGGTVPKELFDRKGIIRNIYIENVRAENAEIPIILAGYMQNKTVSYAENITLKNFDITYAPYKEVYDKRAFIPEYADVYPEAWRFRNLPAYGIWARHVKNLSLLDFNCSVPKSTWKAQFVMEDVK